MIQVYGNAEPIVASILVNTVISRKPVCLVICQADVPLTLKTET